MPMPDLLSVLARQWKMIVLLTLIATAVALIACLLSPKLYLGEATALPANADLSDKGRIFNPNIDVLYPEVGSAEELDKIEGTAMLDTIYIATIEDLHLLAHYGLDEANEHALPKAIEILRRNTDVKRTGFGELKIKAWDKDNQVAANIANALLQKLNAIHQHLQMQNNRIVLQRLKEAYTLKAQALNAKDRMDLNDTAQPINPLRSAGGQEQLTQQLQQYNQLINEYELALKTTPNALLVVEPARPRIYTDKPDTTKVLLFSFLASFAFSFLLAFYVESRNKTA